MEASIKLMRNALVSDSLYKLSREDKHKIVKVLLKGKSERELARELGIPRSTVNDWSSLRQNSVGKHIHVSLAVIYRKITDLEAKDVTDWGRIEMIKERCEELLRSRV